MTAESKNFALIGAAGYIAPRHLRAIKETNNNLLAVLDKNDVMGTIDSYFPDADFFLEPERFDRHLDKLRREKTNSIDFVSICSPNYLHDSHIRLALRNEANAICEKPLVLNPWNLDSLSEIEQETGKRIYNVLQLRLHPSIIALKQKIDQENKDEKYEVDLTYITSRGNWYDWSWKGDIQKSGGVATNIGIHFFDMLSWIFGKTQTNITHYSDNRTAAGYLEFEKARVRWFLSIDYDMLPSNIKQQEQRTYRSITISGKEIEFSGGFTDLHTHTYKNILSGKGFGLNDARASIEIAQKIRNDKPKGITGTYHPLLRKV